MIDEAMMLRECIYNLSGQDPQETKAVMQAAASKIDELRAALTQMEAKEADWTAAYQAAYQEATKSTVRGFQLDAKVAAQRKVLEQALEALQHNLKTLFAGDTYDMTTAAITAIQEQLK